MEEHNDFHKVNLLMHVSKLILHSKRAQLDSLELYRGQPRLLFALWEKDGLSRKELGQKLYVQPATITKMVRRLEQSGFVESRQDTEDSRVSRVYLTERGRNIQGEVEQIYSNLENQAFKGFDEVEVIGFIKQLESVRDNLTDEDHPYRGQHPKIECMGDHKV